MNHNKKIKLLYLHANNKDIGGADYCLFKLVDQLDKDRFTPIVCLSMKTAILDLYVKAGVKTYIIDMERIKKSKSPLFLIKLLAKFIPTVLKIVRLIKKEQIDIVHGNDLLDIYGPVAGRIVGIPVAQYIRWILVIPLFFKKILTSFIYLLNDRIITVSDGVAREMFSTNNRIKRKVITCYDWIDMEKVGHNKKSTNIRHEFNIPSDTPVVGVIGRLEYWKGQEVFIRAASIIMESFRSVKFMLIGGVVEGRGREQYRAKLEQLAEKLGIKDSVIFAGHRTDIYNIMNSLDISVHSSVTPDPLPGVVMESMYCSLPVVGANAGGVPEEVADGETGILYTPGNSQEMADAVKYLLENLMIAKQMGIAGKKRVERVFDKNILCRRMENIYNEILGQKTDFQ